MQSTVPAGLESAEPALVGRWLLANLFAVPLLAVVLAVVFGLTNPVLLGLLLVAVTPGAPFIPIVVATAHEAIRLTS